jgi:hypothetical protein
VLKGKVQRQSDFPFFKPVMNAFKTILFGWGYGALLQRRAVSCNLLFYCNFSSLLCG